MKVNFDNIQEDVDAIGRIPIVPKLLEVICRTTGMGFAAIARVTENKWIACSVRDEIFFGLEPGGELQLETTICNEIRQSGEAVIIDHVENDLLFHNHHTPAMYGFQSYISVPIIRKDGTFFGTLCAIDTKPAILNTPEIIGMFGLYADLISFHLNAIEQMAFTETRLAEEYKTAELREQFIAILGHDLRNPVGAITNCAQLLVRMKLDEKSVRLANIILDSSFRMNGLIDNILDFARGRLGEGIIINLNEEDKLDLVLNEVITEMRVIWPNHIIETRFELAEPINCDINRIAQLFSNILSNALTHGRADTPVEVEAVSGDGEFRLSVINYGDKIPAVTIDRLFQPFSRGEVKSGQGGLGLGLYIANEIAHAHGGKIEVLSTSKETRFTFRMPAK